MNEISIEKIAISTWEKFWNKFLLFRNISAGVIGPYNKNLQINTGYNRARIRLVHSVQMVGTFTWSDLGFSHSTFIIFGTQKPIKTEEPSAPNYNSDHKIIPPNQRPRKNV